MEKKEMEEAEVELVFPPSPTLTIGIAINGSRESKYVIKWALEKFVSEGNAVFKLLHVRARITAVPTPMGNLIPISQVRDDVAAAYRKELEWQANERLLPYKKFCTQRKVEADIISIESNEVANAIAEEVSKNTITRLVIGASSRGMFTRKLKKNSLSSRISARTPSFCTVYAVSKGKLSSIRPADSEMNGSIKDDSSETSFSSNNSSGYTFSSQTELGSVASYATFRNGDMSSRPSCAESGEAFSRNSSLRSLPTDQRSSLLDQICTSDVQTDCFPSECQVVNINFELENLTTELRHIREMYAVAQSETIDASRKLNSLSERRLEEAMKLKEVSSKEEKAKELVRQEKEKSEAARREAEHVKESRTAIPKFEWEEIVLATSSFSEDLRVGMGSYGTVYKCKFHHTAAAVKVLHSKESSRTKQFQQELEILSKICHPHLLLLLGACPEHGCLVYEYMENGSLEDRLLRKNNTPPIPWFERYRIAWEVGSALVFLHNSKPKPIIHRDLKPANILLDHNFVSKIGDVGLSMMITADSCSTSTMYKDTAPVGTLCYIDPEYQRTGLVSTKSDIYAFGMTILQLLTAKPAIALTHVVETAIDNDNLTGILDSEAGNWPVEETKELARLGLSCSELRRKDRPD
ncbi:U-box domain-containing protein 35 [Hibiscus syriacus]|uniref:RING-type E3 ubiquitin transferase n=1 Tax=Hibiscus syriacus TaxID=106335 RepID=A0A6A2ZAT6_HIBSY|nr:U-box domain-containing protein 35 [Hibiscus syriacus]